MLTRIKNSIPNTITCLNLLSGVMACIFAFHYAEPFGPLAGFQWAFICIGAAAVFDFCDGAAARLLHAYSDLGKELDSLADLISFGLAPGLLVFNTVAIANANPFSPWAFIALFIPVMGALRLAKFNIDTRQTTSFIGLPIPSEAIFWIGLVAWINSSESYPGNIAMAVVIIVMALMMVSTLPMFSLKFKNFNLRENALRYAILAAAVVLVTVAGVAGFMWTILLYIVLSAATCLATANNSGKDR